MHSLARKLTFSFLLVGIVGAMLVGVFLWQRTRHVFDEFMFDPWSGTVVNILTGYYVANGSWERVDIFLQQQDPRFDYPYGPLAVVDGDGTILYGEADYVTGTQLAAGDLDDAAPIVIDGVTVGWLLIAPFSLAPDGRFPAGGPIADLMLSTVWSVVGASTIALVLGMWLARSLARPIQELTAATQRMAGGDLEQQVAIRSRDEIGALASSFNQMSRDLAQATAARRQMTADIAHDLRTPLTVLMGYTEPLRDGNLDGSPELYAIMHDEVVHLKHLIDDLRILSLADMGELPLHRRPVDPQALLERAGAAHIALAEQQGVRLRVAAAAADLPPIEVDVERMAQVLNNLVGNALRHTPAGGEIVLAAVYEAKPVAGHGIIYLSVRDTGVGIASEHLPHIFDRFYRADHSRVRQDGATGLGLAIARSIVEAHGGAISAESALEKGSTFIISLPTAAGVPIAAEPIMPGEG